jgi:hypothetical protein
LAATVAGVAVRVGCTGGPDDGRPTAEAAGTLGPRASAGATADVAVEVTCSRVLVAVLVTGAVAAATVVVAVSAVAETVVVAAATVWVATLVTASTGAAGATD